MILELPFTTKAAAILALKRINTATGYPKPEVRTYSYSAIEQKEGIFSLVLLNCDQEVWCTGLQEDEKLAVREYVPAVSLGTG